MTFPPLLFQQRAVFSATVAAPFGAPGIRTEADTLRPLMCLPPRFGKKDACDAVASEAGAQIARYFADADGGCQVPLGEAGSIDQQQVWA
ncbi:MAG: hypothetical protein H7335_08210 [Massilia sp.]|nr:hypothetical protein [Massilia sp.]